MVLTALFQDSWITRFFQSHFWHWRRYFSLFHEVLGDDGSLFQPIISLFFINFKLISFSPLLLNFLQPCSSDGCQLFLILLNLCQALFQNVLVLILVDPFSDSISVLLGIQIWLLLLLSLFLIIFGVLEFYNSSIIALRVTSTSFGLVFLAFRCL